jgi:2,4-dienoyl-CoA reductase-like NADH-dependent reductase (Old Yellow Enzyme family)
MARPFIREPDLVRQIEAGRRGLVDCVSCNICLDHEGVHGLKCWRVHKRDLAVHALYRFTGRLK